MSEEELPISVPLTSIPLELQPPERLIEIGDRKVQAGANPKPTTVKMKPPLPTPPSKPKK